MKVILFVLQEWGPRCGGCGTQVDSECTVTALACTGNRHCLLDAEGRGGSGEGYPSICTTYHISLSHVCTSPPQLFWWVKLSFLNILIVISVFKYLILNFIFWSIKGIIVCSIKLLTGLFYWALSYFVHCMWLLNVILLPVRLICFSL
jgi:hypothetical protein